VDLDARANFPAIFGASLEDKHAILADTSVTFTDEDPYVGNQLPAGDGQTYKLQICVEAWATKLYDSGAPDDKLRVATLKITVKPPDDEP